MAVYDEGDSEGDHDGNHHESGLQVVVRTVPRGDNLSLELLEHFI